MGVMCGVRAYLLLFLRRRPPARWRWSRLRRTHEAAEHTKRVARLCHEQPRQDLCCSFLRRNGWRWALQPDVLSQANSAASTTIPITTHISTHTISEIWRLGTIVPTNGAGRWNTIEEPASMYAVDQAPSAEPYPPFSRSWITICTD